MKSDEQIARGVPNALIPTKLELQYVRAGREAVLREVVSRTKCVYLPPDDCRLMLGETGAGWCIHCWAKRGSA